MRSNRWFSPGDRELREVRKTLPLGTYTRTTVCLVTADSAQVTDWSLDASLDNLLSGWSGSLTVALWAAVLQNSVVEQGVTLEILFEGPYTILVLMTNGLWTSYATVTLTKATTGLFGADHP